MEVEKKENMENTAQIEPVKKAENTLILSFKTFSDNFKSSVDKKDSSEIGYLTKVLKKMYAHLTLKNFTDLLNALKTTFSEFIQDSIKSPSKEVPSPRTEEDVSLLILLSLYLFKTKEFKYSSLILHKLLFEKPQEASQKSYIEPLANYLLYKYLNALEFSGNFQEKKQELYLILKSTQSGRQESLFSTLYIFILRNLLKQKNLDEVAQLLKNCEFPEHLNYSQLCKFLFYKGLFLAKTGQISQALNFISESLRKAPEEQQNKKAGVKGFIRLAQKQQIVLLLFLNERPAPRLFLQDTSLWRYRLITSYVSLGKNKEFQELLDKEKVSFEKDYTLSLLEKMRNVVLRNSLKKLSTAYTKISISDALGRIGISNEQKFELPAFLAKSREHIEKFNYDPRNQIIDFARTREHYSDSMVRETLLKRIKHVHGLEEQVIRSLKYKERVVETNEGVDEFDDDDDDDLELDFSLDDLDI